MKLKLISILSESDRIEIKLIFKRGPGVSGVSPKTNRSARVKILKDADCLGPPRAPARPKFLINPFNIIPSGTWAEAHM